MPPFGTTICGIEELAGHGETRATHVLSILDPDFPVPEAFGAWGEHAKLELRFHDIIEETAGMIAPTVRDIAALLAFGRDIDATRRAHLLVHCHAGISRSTAAMLLLLAEAQPRRPGAELVADLLALRDKAWPNLRMVELGDRMLGRDGDLVAAVPEAYRFQMARRPQIEAFMREGGRTREVELGLRR